MAVPAFVRTGAAGLDELGEGNSKFVKLKVGKPMEIVPLTGVDGIVSFNQHALWDIEPAPIFPCFGEAWCPGEIIGDKPKFRALLLCISKEDPDTEVILPMGMSIFKQMVQIEEALGGPIKGQVIRVSRTGEGINTKYTALPTGRRVKVTSTPETNLLENLGPTTPEEVIEMLEKAGAWTDENQAEYDRRRKAWKAAKGRGPMIEDEDDGDASEDDEEDAPPTPKKTAKKDGVDFSKHLKAKAAPVEEEEEDDEDEAPTPKKSTKPLTKPAPKSSKKPPVEESDDEDDDFEDLDEE